LGEGNEPAALKSRTSAAIRVSKAVASNAVILSMPQCPARRAAQVVSILLPRGETTPRPVITTLRSLELPAINQTGQLGLTPAGAAPESFSCGVISAGCRQYI
jgi:hypothetical protein